MLALRKFIMRYPEKDLIPGFAKVNEGEASENRTDEKDILKDKDVTNDFSVLSTVKRFRMTDTELEPLEDLPADFMRGEIDVKQQMDLAASALESSLQGLQKQSEEDSPRGELGASYRDTPGGLEEAAAKTDEFLASHGLKKDLKNLRKKKRTQRTVKGF